MVSCQPASMWSVRIANPPRIVCRASLSAVCVPDLVAAGLPMFRRHLSDAFINELNRLYLLGTWWATLADGPGVFLAVRDDALNAYSGGMSVAKVAWDGRRVRLLVHEEYLTLASPSASPYVDLLAADGRSRLVILTPEEYVARFRAVRTR